MMRRRQFITLLGGAVVAWPSAARTQQRERMRRVGVLQNLAADDPEGHARIAVFVEGLRQLGWTDGRNLRIDIRWAVGDSELNRKYAAELVALAPDAILAVTSLAVEALRRVTRTVPIIFVQVADPVGAGFVEDLARPGGNITGFTLFEYGISGKWLELLKEIAPHVTRVAVLRDPAVAAGAGQLGAIQSVAPSFGVELRPIGVRDTEEIEHGIMAAGRAPNWGLIVTATTQANVHRNLIITLAARHKLPAVYSDRTFVVSGGLISYGPNRIGPFRLAADYIDRIFKGEKATALPVQAPTKYETVLSLKAAKALGIEVSPMLLARADEVIE
jgi:ABC-type uncharacterized transport system substrate-binding protein